MYKKCLVLMAICLQASEIRISEVMSNPQGSEYENEYIEIYNTSQSVIQINGWVLSDGNGVDTISHWSGPVGVNAQEYAIILDPGYDFSAGIYNDLIPDSISVFTIGTDASFGSGGLSNSGETVTIYSPDTASLSSMSWSTASDNGYSWERISINADDSLAVWQQSVFENGTPGFQNSVTPPQNNIRIDSVEVNHIEIGEPIEITVSVTNTGENLVSEFALGIYVDENQNQEQDESEWELTLYYLTIIEPNQNINLPINLLNLESGVQFIEINSSMEGDEVEDDDTLRFQVVGAYSRNAISITEIMYSPVSEQGGEWVEIKNISAHDISLQNWTLSDANLTTHMITQDLLFLAPDSHLTLCDQSGSIDFYSLTPENSRLMDTWPTLNSGSDSVRLFDATGGLIASCFYRGSWGEVGTSLERHHPRLFPVEVWNWSPSTHPDGGTPSRINTQQLPSMAIQIDAIEISTPDSIGPAQVFISISFWNVGMDTLRSLQIELDYVSTWSGNLPSFEMDSIVIGSSILEAGISDVPIRIYDDGGLLLADTSVQVALGFLPGQIAINEIHYLPDEDQVEFLELINIGGDTLNLEGWDVRDRSGTLGLISQTTSIPPDSMFLLCGDSNALHDWTFSQAQILELSSWPSLNNSSDSILIRDARGNRQLSHAYNSAQGGESGKSMERLALWKSAELDGTWESSVDPSGITPGRINSRSATANNISIIELKLLDTLLVVDQDITIQTTLVNSGASPVLSGELVIQLLGADGLLASYDLTLPILIPGDTSIWQSELQIGDCGWIDVVAELGFSEDEFTLDNMMSAKAYISCSTTPILINEILPIPGTGQSEWVEIYNNSDKHIDLLGWKLSDNTSSESLIADSSVIFSPGAYLILTEMDGVVQCPQYCQVLEIEGFPTLNNSADAVILFDPQSVLNDEMSYDEFTAMVEGRSLERIRMDIPGSESRNWGISLDESGASPGFENSLHLVELAQTLKIDLWPNPFTPNGDGQSDALHVNYELPVEQGLMSIMIFDMAGRKIAHPWLAQPVSHRGQFQWNGEASYGGIAVTGMYICKVMVDDLHGNVTEILKKIYLVN